MDSSKIFSQKLCDENDRPAREVVKEFYSRIGINLKDNPNTYGVDLISEDSSLCVEVECRHVWDEPEFPFDTVNFLNRKMKFVKLHKYNIFEFVIVSYDFKRLGIINRDTLMANIEKTSLRALSNRFVAEGEKFYQIPKNQFTWFLT